jgi:DNA-binding response OmpR family regulator
MDAGPLRILIVDDHADAARALRAVLASEGHDARVALDGRGALAAAVAFRPDVVLLDLGLPDLDGAEVADALRRLPGLSGCRLAAVTGRGPEALPAPSPFDAYYSKPVPLEALLADLAATRRRGATDAAEAAA